MIIVLCFIYLLGCGITFSLLEDKFNSSSDAIVPITIFWPPAWLVILGVMLGKKIKESLDKASK